MGTPQQEFWALWNRFFKNKNDQIERRNEYKISDILVLLDVDYEKYKMIATAIKKKWQKLVYLGKVYKIFPPKKFQSVFAIITTSFAAVFDTPFFIVKCIYFNKIAQQCNANLHKKKYCDNINNRGRLAPNLNTRVKLSINICGKNVITVMTLFDCTNGKTFYTNVQMADIHYDIFLTIFRKDILFFVRTEAILWKFTPKMVVEIKNERFWKAALLEMRTDRVDRLILYMRSSPPGISFRNTAYGCFHIYTDTA